MKKAADPRHLKRIKIVKELFAHSFAPKKASDSVTQGVLKNLKSLDNLITNVAPAFPLDKISKIDLAILRLAVFEIVIDKKQPVKVIIDEAVEIAKAFGNENSAKFINGVLGAIYNGQSKNP